MWAQLSCTAVVAVVRYCYSRPDESFVVDYLIFTFKYFENYPRTGTTAYLSVISLLKRNTFAIISCNVIPLLLQPLDCSVGVGIT